MKAIDFTQPGGFPLTQNQLGYLQQAYTETITALAAIGGGSSSPFIVSGIEIANPVDGTYIISDGWFFYNGEVVKCLSGSVVGASGGSDAYIIIANDSSPLVFNDGSTPNVVFDKTATLSVLPSGTPTDDTHFPLSALQPFGKGLGATNREASWNTLAVGTSAAEGGVVGTMYYKKDFISNTLHLRGMLTANNAQNFAASPGSLLYLMCLLPVEYRPLSNLYFSAYFYIATSTKDDSNVSWIKQLNCVYNVAGQVLFNWIKPEVGVDAYGVNFNVILPLD